MRYRAANGLGDQLGRRAVDGVPRGRRRCRSDVPLIVGARNVEHDRLQQDPAMRRSVDVVAQATDAAASVSSDSSSTRAGRLASLAGVAP
jgi:hypothetical protein